MSDTVFLVFLGVIALGLFLFTFGYLTYRDRQRRKGLKPNEFYLFGVKWTWHKYRLRDLLQSHNFPTKETDDRGA